jgi:hypothetical protein
MKAIIYVLAAVLLVSFTDRQVNAVDGVWTGIYRSDNLREKVLVRFESKNQVALYSGDVAETNKCIGNYELVGDSLLKFTYHDAAGKEYTMQGSINKKMNYVDGVWETSDKLKGSFYLKKEKLEEMFIQP